jgi:CO/xanthine dehydrogenase Mo-binding subunit
MGNTFLYIGKRIPRSDAANKVTGRIKFSGDILLPNTLYIKILRSPHAHAKILGINTKNAEQIPGVKYVLTYKDKLIWPYYGKKIYAFARDKVRFVGDEVAAVAGVSEEIAEEAIDTIEVDYEVLRPVFDPKDSLKPDAPKIWPQGNDARSEIYGSPQYIRGNVKKGFKEADVVIEDKFETSIQSHVNMETRTCLAVWKHGKLIVYNATQGIFGCRQTIATALGLPLSKVRVIVNSTMGFGSKATGQKDAVIASWIAMKTGRPARITYSRDEEICSHPRRADVIMDIKLGAKKDGKLTAMQFNALSNVGAYGAIYPLNELIQGLYKCPNVKAEDYAVYTNTPPSMFLRGVHGPPAFFALECAMDELANELKIDPLELRLRNHTTLGDQRKRTRYTSEALIECMREGANRINWCEKRNTELQNMSVKKRGVGMAIFRGWGTGLHPFEANAIIICYHDGSATLFCGATDIGTGVSTVMKQIAAEESGLRYEDITVIFGDTDRTPPGPSSHACRVTAELGPAVKEAAAHLKLQLLKIAASTFHVEPEKLDTKNGYLIFKDNDAKKIQIKDLLISGGRSYASAVVGFGKRKPNPPSPYVGIDARMSTFGATFAEVEVDTDTGYVRVLRLITAIDCGTVLNPLLAESQVNGSHAMGLGYALSEETILDRTTGKILNPGYLDYKFFTADKLPDEEVIFVEPELKLKFPSEPYLAYGAKGIGEISLLAVAPAVANAIHNAIGKRPKRLPITPDEILELIQKVRGTN